MKDPPNRIYARLNGDIACLTIGDSVETQWKTYIGSSVKILVAGERYLAAASDREITVLDRETGETLSQIIIANTEQTAANKIKLGAFKRKSSAQSETFAQAYIHNGVVFCGDGIAARCVGCGERQGALGTFAD